ncbi:MAG: hypothetical protein CM15mP95_0920 [Alphaproteobacteria bacterium]|nr:MAG: hypothetical protein CM15mP95_0920 [Alphaproteobacteria bacterium]
MSADVELQNISINFGDFYAAKNVSVMINKGSSLASLAHLVAVRPPYFEPFPDFRTVTGPGANWWQEYGWHWPQ